MDELIERLEKVTEPERTEMVATAARMRDAGATLELIAKTLGVARLTARTWAAEKRGA